MQTQNLSNKKTANHDLQFDGSYLKEDTMYKLAPDVIYNTEIRPPLWFRMFIGQLIYAASEKGFNGFVELVNEDHAAKLCELQGRGYRFHSIVGIGKVLYSSELVANQEEKPHEDENELLAKRVVAAIDNYLDVRGTKGLYYHTMNSLVNLLTYDDLYSRADDLGYFLDRIRVFLFDPAIANAFYSQNQSFGPNDVYKLLERLIFFFEMMEQEIRDAEIVRFQFHDSPKLTCMKYAQRQRNPVEEIEFYNKRALSMKVSQEIEG